MPPLLSFLQQLGERTLFREAHRSIKAYVGERTVVWRQAALSIFELKKYRPFTFEAGRPFIFDVPKSVLASTDNFMSRRLPDANSFNDEGLSGTENELRG